MVTEASTSVLFTQPESLGGIYTHRVKCWGKDRLQETARQERRKRWS